MSTLNPYLSFDGNCREAMTFYQECFGGELTFMTVKETPMADQMPPEMQDKIMHSGLTSGGIVLMASEMGPEAFVSGNTVSITINCDSGEELDKYFAHLNQGGNAFCEPSPTFFADKFAGLTDKFGTKWLLISGSKSV